MKKTLSTLATMGLALMPLVASAHVSAGVGSGGLDTAISVAYYFSAAAFLVASIMMGLAVMQFGKSALGSIFTYFFVGTSVFFVITIFQQLGEGFFGISEDSMDIWWHLMFYIAMISYFLGLKALVGLGSADSSQSTMLSSIAKVWAVLVAVLLGSIFIIPAAAEPIVQAYNATALSAFGLHHFMAFAIAAIVGWYLLSAKKNIGQIGQAIANPMLITIFALALQHLWELQFESWHTVDVSSTVGEGGERIFLTVAAIGVTLAAWRLRSNARG